MKDVDWLMSEAERSGAPVVVTVRPCTGVVGTEETTVTGAVVVVGLTVVVVGVGTVVVTTLGVTVAFVVVTVLGVA